MLLDEEGTDEVRGLFLAPDVWQPLSLGRFVRDVCNKLVGDDREATLTVYGHLPDRRNLGVFTWPADGQQAFLKTQSV